MLSYALAIAVATISLVLFLTAFLMSDIHRKDDFLWSGVGFIYALVLWFCARNITGAVLLGQTAATAVLVSSTWQTLKLRRAIANPDRAAEIYNFSVWQKIQGLLKSKQPRVKSTATPVETPVTPKVTEQEIAIPDTPSEATESVEQAARATKTATKVNAPKAESEILQRSTTPENQVTTDSQPVVPPDDRALETKKNIAQNPTSSSQASEPKNNTVQKEQTPTITSVETKENIAQNPTSSNQASELKNNTVQKEQTPNITSVEPQVKTKDNIAEPATSSTAPIEPQVEPKSTIVPPASQAISEEDSEPKDRTLDIKPVSDFAPETKPAVSKTSSLDSLETVEVAEVLEASENMSFVRETNDPNIIEVTTTEINITTEVKKVEQEQEDNPDSSREL